MRQDSAGPGESAVILRQLPGELWVDLTGDCRRSLEPGVTEQRTQNVVETGVLTSELQHLGNASPFCIVEVPPYDFGFRVADDRGAELSMLRLLSGLLQQPA